ncbi:troponin C-like isoform X1 [Oratosquilla oratoria]|uniref:troponin C-like isoform X1 n=1 Tax=Oratosquilla oratoria TaxID=337810 RepID=UPI003F766450
MTDELDDEKMAMLRKAFAMFDSGKTGQIEKEKIRTILNTLGANYDPEELEALLEECDLEGTGKLNFDNFVKVVGHFLEEQDEEAMMKELKEAFRLYDKEGNGFIPTSSLKEILAALDDKLTDKDLDGIIEEIDTDGSGTVDFDGKLMDEWMDG